ncbi:hypothetical protein [Lacticaseibacillus manihotivorans]|uniref:DUF1642 domain-containing protein n=2 Tax=Lacticaseibacillus manihotivorans TaxID=88233 RepID=A0A0R1QNZ7_9LACO|nr:hypothetical protein [Lacticaseibacillus manihotivorans]KRL42568.1 hypothetical protein FD01_GL001889 [Lacticaseibacillus manihotivorans DSM 13343 = JCM 12514]QFQ91778.1 hypothetical protein LM010_10240 [Lacticaseibacillus manihotivorans]
MTDKAKLYAVKNDEGEWMSLDGTKMGIWYSNNPTLFKDKSYAEAQSMGRKAHVVTLVEEQKVNLPREVGEELDDYQAEDIDLLDYLHDVIDSEELRVTRVWMLHDREHRIGILADAYRYGWEAEPEAKWYVKAPESWGFNGYYFCKHINGQVFPENPNPAAFDSDWTQFTRAELKKYHFDSDIFTLVPVEADKEVSR